MSEPTHEQFRALARSSPWLWQSLRFEYIERGWAWDNRHVRAWVRRPGGLRVESTTGELLQAGIESEGGNTVMLVAVGGDCDEPDHAPEHGTEPTDPGPEWVDGLVAASPATWALHDDPMFVNYRWVAMLNPVELADGEVEGLSASSTPPAAQIDTLVAKTVAGREVWEATLRPVAAYDPRCSCCPLLRSAASDARESEAGLEVDPPAGGYPTSHLVRLDRQTGVCVYTEEVGGATPGRGHEVRIEAVDESYPDELFAEPKQRRGLRRRRSL